MSEAEAPRSGESRSVPVVGIGSSAGGVEACTTFLKFLADDLGMAYVFVQHLDPSRESALTDILKRATTMPVQEIQDGMQVQRNQVYIIPRNCEVRIIGASCICRNVSTLGR